MNSNITSHISRSFIRELSFSKQLGITNLTTRTSTTTNTTTTIPIRSFSSPSGPGTPPNGGDNGGDKRVQMGKKILDKVPNFLKPYTINFITKPVSNLTSFLILHELTAIAPLIGLWYIFHKYQVSVPFDLPQWAIDKGTKIIDDSLKSFDFTGFSLNEKFKLITHGAYAYVIVKAILPLRIMISFALTPVFTRFVIDPITGLFKSRKVKVEEKVEEIKLKKIEKPRL